MKNKLLIVALALAAVVLIGGHLRMPHSTQVWRMTSSEALARDGEKMPVAMPQGDVDVNATTAEALTALTGVGPSLAQEIIAEREINGNFHYPEDLINVKGIGEKTLQNLIRRIKLP